jgi:hypothetical protein
MNQEEVSPASKIEKTPKLNSMESLADSLDAELDDSKLDKADKKAEVVEKKVEASEEKVEVATQAETKSLNAEVGIGIAKRIEATPHTADNTGKLAGEYAALGGVCRNTGIPAEFTTVEISPVIKKGFGWGKFAREFFLEGFALATQTKSSAAF